MLSLTQATRLQGGMQITTGWNDSFQPFVPRRDGFPLARLRFSQCSAAPPLQACRGASLTPPPGVCPVEGGKSARGRACEFGRDSRLPLSDSILPVAVAMETGECFSRVNSAALCTTSNAAAMIQAAARQGAPTTAEQSAYKAVCVRECVQGL